MNNLKRISAAVLAGMALMSASGASHGMGFGHASSRAILGDTLRVTVPLRLEAGEEVTRECLAADVYLGEDKVTPKVIQIDLLPGEGGGDRSVVVSSTIAISEPVVTIYLAAGCQSRVTRKIVLFPDPPTFVASPTTAPVSLADKIESASLPAASNVSPPGALPPVAVPASPSRKADRASGTSRGRASSVHGRSSGRTGALPSMVMADVVDSGGQGGGSRKSESGKPKSSRSDGRKRGGASQTVATSQGDGGRLLLDPVDADAMVIPDLRMTPTLGAMASADENSPEVKARRDAAAALWLALNASPEQMARDRERLQQLEQRLGQLQKEGEQARQSVQALQAKVQAAASQRAGRWTYLLALLTIAASVTAAYLYMRLRRVSGGSWWQASEHSSLNEQEPELDAEGHTSTEFVHVPDAADSTPGAYPAATSRSAAAFASVPAAPLASEPHRPLASASLHQMVPDAAPAPFPSPTPRQPQTESLREVSVEELIDLEQQAEFFVVLGQDDAAIDLLESHVLHTTGASPLPFLKLLEIYRRVGKRPEYERVQAEFNKRFNAYAPSWDADLQQGHSLADYPGVVERLQSLWQTPAEAMVVLEKSLTRPESGEDTFELPAYRELLFLYAVARDLSERDGGERQSVDLLLPVIDFSGAEPSTSVVHSTSIIEPLMATRPTKAHPEVSPSIKLDLQLDDLPEPDSDHKP